MSDYSSSDDEMLTIRSPNERIRGGIAKVSPLLSSLDGEILII